MQVEQEKRKKELQERIKQRLEKEKYDSWFRTLHLVEPTFNHETKQVTANLAAIVAVRRWYQTLEKKMLTQFELTPELVNGYKDQGWTHILEKEITTSVAEPFPISFPE